MLVELERDPERFLLNQAQEGVLGVTMAPEQVHGIGLDASWFPTDSRLMTTDGNSLITVDVHWPGVKQRRMQALAAAVAKRYLGPLDWKAADPPGSGT